MSRPASLLLAVVLSFPHVTLAAKPKPRIPVGEFHARRFAKAPTVDGKIARGEWDEALTASGMVTCFSHKMLEADTTVALGFDDKRFYFLADCTRGNREWKLWKHARENDAYSFGDPSIEIWISPPTIVPETYQNIINTYPAVMDVKNIPSRGYSAMGWTGTWDLGVTESPERYVIEASIPIRDFGFDGVKDGDVWRFLLARTSPGSKPRAQASWSITQGFGEIAQYPKVHLMDDCPLLQVYSMISAFTGTFDFPMAVVAPRKRGADVVVTMRIQKDVTPADGDKVLTKSFSLKAGERKAFRLTGDVTALKQGVFTITAATKAGKVFFRQGVPFNVNGFVHKPPVKPEGAPEPRELDVKAMYGPESHVLLVTADLIDLPGRQRAAKAVAKVLDAKSKRVLLAQPLPAIRNWLASGPVFLGKKVRPPLYNEANAEYVERYNANLPAENRQRAKQGKPPLKPREIPKPEPKPVIVEVSVLDEAGKVLRSASQEVGLLQYKFHWSGNDVGITDEVIPPQTPVTWDGAGGVGVWNRTMKLNGLGLLERIDNGGTSQVERMRIVATAGSRFAEIKPSKPAIQHRVPNAVTFTGTGTGAGLRLSATTRVESDGFVLSELTIAPMGLPPGAAAMKPAPAKIDKLTLEIVLPESEATHFCTTAGGWAAVHDETPKYWSSRQTASGLLIGDFVPYIWLTNSDRAFCWFADSDKGWVTDDDKSLPTQEIVREGGKVMLRVHFVELPTEIKEPTTLTYGYQTYPSRPLPAGWRSIICTGGRSAHLPSARYTYFWHDGNWAVLWPYYCSPYPWDMAKSRKTYERLPRNTNHRPMVGSIAHSVARYRDYNGNTFDGYVVDWGANPGDRSNGNCTQSTGPIDFRVWHYRRWVREGDFRGLYIDENYLGLETNFLTGRAYLRADGRLQRAYSYLGLREYYKRMKAMFHRELAPAPNLWMHISSGAAYYAWLGDIFFEGENVEPTDLEYDYIEVLPAARMRAIGSAKCAGGAMTMMCQSQRHATVHEPKHTHQFVGWVMAHDILPEQVRFWEVIAQAGRLYEGDVAFVGYWKAKCPAKTSAPKCLVSVHKVRDSAGGRRALLWIVNTGRADRAVDVKLDFAAMGMDRAKAVAVNAETGEAVTLTGGKLRLGVLKRDFAAVHLVERRALTGSETFRATFDGESDEADEALGCCVFQPLAWRKGQRDAKLVRVRGVRGAALGGAFEFRPHLHLGDDEGRLSFHAQLPDAERPGGAILSAGRVTIALKGRTDPEIILTSDVNPITGKDRRGRAVRGKDKKLIRQVSAGKPGGGWHHFELTWQAGKLRLRLDGRDAAEAEFKGFGIGRPVGKELTAVPRFGFGLRGGAEAFDEIRCWRRAR